MICNNTNPKAKTLRCKIDNVAVGQAENLGLCMVCDPETARPCRLRLDVKASLRESDYWTYAYRKYCLMFDRAPAAIRRTWTIQAIQDHAAEFAAKAVKEFGTDKPQIRFDDLGQAIVRGEKWSW